MLRKISAVICDLMVLDTQPALLTSVRMFNDGNPEEETRETQQNDRMKDRTGVTTFPENELMLMCCYDEQLQALSLVLSAGQLEMRCTLDIPEV